MRFARSLLTLAFLVALTFVGAQPQQIVAATLPPLPASWPSTFQLGMSGGPGSAPGMRGTAPFLMRYQYLAGGANTGGGWATWNPNGTFVSNYVQESVANSMTSVFSYYMLRQSNPGGSDDPTAITNNLANTQTMASYFSDIKLFMQRASGSGRVILHFEPDLWGVIQLRATNDNAATVSAKVGSLGMSELAGLPDNASGIAKAVLKLRDLYAPNVHVAYHLSVWGTGNDILYTDPADSTIDALANRAVTFYRSLGANFDIAFTDPSDRDAAFKQYQYGDGGAAWWSDADYTRSARFIGGFVTGAAKRMVLWQIPLGNTKMRAQNNTWGHYQDNHVQYFIDDPGRTHLSLYANAGVVAALFGGGAGGTTCACDGTGDGITNPAAINGNTIASYNADDDGGFFGNRAAAYYVAGALVLPGGAATASVSGSPSAITAGSTLTVTWSNIGSPVPSDWIGLAPVGGAATTYVAWRYTNGAASGSAPLVVPASAAPGSYELRLFAANAFTRLATSAPVTVTAGANVSGTPTSIATGGTLTVNWSNIGTPTATDWIGLAPVGSAATSYVAWRYTTGTASGAGPLVVPTGVAAGTYELRLFAADGFTKLATSAPLAVAAGATVSGTPASITAGGTLTMTWTSIGSPTPTDWIGLAPVGGVASSYVAWRYTTGTASGSGPFVVPVGVATGTYELRLYAADGFTLLARSTAISVH